MPEYVTYDERTSDVFRFTKADNGFYSNFAPYPVTVPTSAGHIPVPDTETLYQALKFEDPGCQERVLFAASPKEAKEIARSLPQSAMVQDWDRKGRLVAMRYALGLKIGQNRDEAVRVMRASGQKPIVEFSNRDDFWGAKPAANGMLAGRNVLGRMLGGFRDKLFEHAWSPMTWPAQVPPPEGMRLLEADILTWRRDPVTLNARVTGTNVPGAIYVGRRPNGVPAPFGNPVAQRDGVSKEDAIAGYLKHLREKPGLVERIRREIGGHDVICWCAPKPCHGDIIRHIAAGNAVPDTWGPERGVIGPEDRQTAMEF